MKRKGLTLLETVLALFVLAGSCLGAVMTLNQVVRYRQIGQYRLEAALVARGRLEALQNWAADSAHFYGSWAGQLGQFSDPDHPNFTVEVRRGSPRAVFSPARMVEETVTFPRNLNQSAYPVAVEAWLNSSNRTRVTLNSLIAAPNPLASGQNLTLQITQVGGASPLVGLTEAEFDVNASLPGGTPAETMFYWTILPLDGNGTVLDDTLSRDGTRIKLKNAIRLPATGSWQVWPGQVGLKASTRFHGKTYSAVTYVTLQP